MCSFASNAIGSHAAPLRATLLHFFSKNIFRTLFFCTRSQKATFKGFPTKWYTLSLYESALLEQLLWSDRGLGPSPLARNTIVWRGRLQCSFASFNGCADEKTLGPFKLLSQTNGKGKRQARALREYPLRAGMRRCPCQHTENTRRAHMWPALQCVQKESQKQWSRDDTDAVSGCASGTTW